MNHVDFNIKAGMKVSLESITTFLFALAPILSIYATPILSISIGEIMLIGVGFLLISSNRSNLTHTKNYIGYIVYSIIITIAMSCYHMDIFGSDTIKEMISFVAYSCLAILYAKRMNLDLYIEKYQTIAFVAAIYLIIQSVVHMIAGIWLPGMIPEVMTDSGVSTTLLIERYSRACSFFKEPAHFAQFMSIPLSTILFSEKHNRKFFIYLSVYIISLALSFSGNAMAILGTSFLFYLFYLFRSGEGKKTVKASLLIVVIVSLGFLLIKTNSQVQELFGRLTSGELLGTYAPRVSGYVRIVRGYVVYLSFGLLEKVFGIGMGNYSTFAIHYCRDALYSRASRYDPSYINGIQFFLTSTGMIGLIMYLYAILKNIRKRKIVIACIAANMLILSAISNLSRGSLWVSFLTIIMCTGYEKRDCEVK